MFYMSENKNIEVRDLSDIKDFSVIKQEIANKLICSNIRKYLHDFDVDSLQYQALNTKSDSLSFECHVYLGPQFNSYKFSCYINFHVKYSDLIQDLHTKNEYILSKQITTTINWPGCGTLPIEDAEFVLHKWHEIIEELHNITRPYEFQHTKFFLASEEQLKVKRIAQAKTATTTWFVNNIPTRAKGLRIGKSVSGYIDDSQTQFCVDEFIYCSLKSSTKQFKCMMKFDESLKSYRFQITRVV